MCGTKSRIFLVSLVLSVLLFFFPLSYSYAEVVLTDSEAQEIMMQIEESQKDLQTVKENYEEQKKYYEQQLTEAREETKTVTTVFGVSTTVLGVALIIAIIL